MDQAGRARLLVIDTKCGSVLLQIVFMIRFNGFFNGKEVRAAVQELTVDFMYLFKLV